VKVVLAAIVALFPTIALAWPSLLAPAAQVPQPAVVRVIATERDGISMGSGSLVAVDTLHGMVVTNWHVVRDAAGPITVVFPDGFRSKALVLRVDRDWDLAALAIQKPKVQPLPIATAAPRPGEPLTIAGYGPDGIYRAVGGRCTEYLSPDGRLPAELVEVDVQARHGDSGGPIYNGHGEIAGVLFGAGGNFLTGGYTMGSYCGRVRQFLAASYIDFERLPGVQDNGQIAGSKEQGGAIASSGGAPLRGLPQPPGFALGPIPAGSSSGSVAGRPPAANPPPPSQQAATGAIAGGGRGSISHIQPVQTNPIAQVTPVGGSAAAEPPRDVADQIKTVLAVIGIIAVLFHGLRLVGSAVG
jgi:hypothetical protein